MKRRNLIQKGALVGLGFLSIRCAKAQKILITPPQTEGPFYPDQEQTDLDEDLTLVDDKTIRAEGTSVIMQVYITDQNGKALSQAMVDVWQACASGRYNHAGDESTATLDPNFQYWALRIPTQLDSFQNDL